MFRIVPAESSVNYFRLATAAFALVALIGCGGSSGTTAHLSGQVTLDGQPLPAGAVASVTFRPSGTSKGRSVSVEIIDSRYDCVNAPKGPVLAVMNISLPTGRTVHSERTGQDYQETAVVQLAPDQMAGIALEVAEDKDDQNLELRRMPARK